MIQRIIGVFLVLLLLSCGKQRLWVKGKVQQKSFSREIPVTIVNGLTFLKVRINGRPCNFLMDTGAPTLIDAQLVKELGLKTKTYGTATDSYDRRNRIDYTLLKTVSLGGVDFTRQGALVSDLRSIPVFDCLNVEPDWIRTKICCPPVLFHNFKNTRNRDIPKHSKPLPTSSG